jgi:hypothetical protein
MDAVYHASDHPGLTLFTPRRYWHSPDFSRSGNLAEGAEPPEGMLEVRAFYAHTWDGVPFYFAPRATRRLQLYARKHGGGGNLSAALPVLGLAPSEAPGGRQLVFAAEDRERLQTHRFSLYTFDATRFRRLPTGEHTAEQPVSPNSETVAGMRWLLWKRAASTSTSHPISTPAAVT